MILLKLYAIIFLGSGMAMPEIQASVCSENIIQSFFFTERYEIDGDDCCSVYTIQAKNFSNESHGSIIISSMLQEKKEVDYRFDQDFRNLFFKTIAYPLFYNDFTAEKFCFNLNQHIKVDSFLDFMLSFCPEIPFQYAFLNEKKQKVKFENSSRHYKIVFCEKITFQAQQFLKTLIDVALKKANNEDCFRDHRLFLKEE